MRQLFNSFFTTKANGWNGAFDLPFHHRSPWRADMGFGHAGPGGTFHITLPIGYGSAR